MWDGSLLNLQRNECLVVQLQSPLYDAPGGDSN